MTTSSGANEDAQAAKAEFVAAGMPEGLADMLSKPVGGWQVASWIRVAWGRANDYVANLRQTRIPGSETDLEAAVGTVSRWVASADVEEWLKGADIMFLDEEQNANFLYLEPYVAGQVSARPSRLYDQAELDQLVTAVACNETQGLSVSQILAVVLVVLIAAGLPFIQVDLPPHVQTVIGDEEATLGIALAITMAVIQQRKK